MKGVYTQRSRKTKVRPIDGISKAWFVTELGDVGEPTIVWIGLAVDLPIAPLRRSPLFCDEQREIRDKLGARAVDDGVIMQTLVSAAFKDGDAADALVEPYSGFAEHAAVQLIEEMPKILNGYCLGQPDLGLHRSHWNGYTLPKRQRHCERRMPIF